MSNDAAVLATIKSKLAPSLNASSVDLFTGSGVQTFNFGVCADNISQILFNFWKANGRMPALIFNDGLPPQYKSQLHTGGIVGWVPWSQGDYSAAYPILNCKVLANPTTFNYQSLVQSTDQGDIYSTESITFSGPLNSRFPHLPGSGAGVGGPGSIVEIPLSNIQAGAFQTWGVLIVAYSRPEFLYASDQGILLTPDGIAMLEKTMAVMSSKYIGDGHFGDSMVTVDQVVHWGVVGIGIPVTLLDQLKSYVDKALNSTGYGSFFIFILQMVMSFVGFYYGAAAMSGLVGGAFTIPNFSGAVSMANRFGINTGELGTALSIANNLTAPTTAVLNTPGGLPMLADSTDFTDVGPAVDSLDMSALDSSTANIDYSNMSIDELNAINPDFSGVLASTTSDANAVYLSDALANISTDAPLSADQVASLTATSTQAAGLVSTAMKAVGATSSSNAATPQQSQAAAQYAANQAANTTGTTSTLWNQAAQLLGMYSQYKIQAQQVARGQLPGSVTIPTAANPVVRQPDGSVTYRNANGTYTTVKPNGQVTSSGSISQLSSFLSGNNVVIIGAALVVGLVVLAKRNR